MAAPVGNKNATKNRQWAEAIDQVLKRAQANKKKGRATLLKLAEKLVDLAEAGDMAALKEIGDRLDGKPRQAIEAEIARSTLEQLIVAAEKLAQ